MFFMNVHNIYLQVIAITIAMLLQTNQFNDQKTLRMNYI